ncbi:MAG TPA: 4Fe-4S binding protein [Spirochaetota bacterium]|mgnify:CR=1 FL=1|nr:4Fe-4S binding protein [Spirochaetota bacterium]HNT09640.1 4Fe-4S binding protein [Spirochaetota bacterium]HNV45663.1 4Fe-4S binding protein [Spirochaetota bacterium]HOS39030.1 4Fe-4S binding protein [Spirochaetota bacterium]HPI22706.1 4Fe-4S binding protein [Spirochaetota bacterium]
MIAFDASKCVGCGQCVKVCPQGVIVMRDGVAAITDVRSCMECGACRLNCDAGAIELTKGTGCLVAIIREDILKTVPKGTGCGCGTDTTKIPGCC